jgi:hypothetical protein
MTSRIPLIKGKKKEELNYLPRSRGGTGESVNNLSLVRYEITEETKLLCRRSEKDFNGRRFKFKI